MEKYWALNLHRILNTVIIVDRISTLQWFIALKFYAAFIFYAINEVRFPSTNDIIRCNLHLTLYVMIRSCRCPLTYSFWFNGGGFCDL